MVEEIDQAVRRAAHAIAAPERRTGRLEEAPDAPGERIGPGRRGLRNRRVALDEQVVGQNDPIAFLHRANLMVAIGIEGD